MIADLIEYVTLDHAEIIDRARACGRYEQVRRSVVIPDPNSTIVVQTRSGLRSTIKAANFAANVRRRSLIGLQAPSTGARSRTWMPYCSSRSTWSKSSRISLDPTARK